MVRPRKKRHVDFEPDVTYFKPRSVPLNQLEETVITIDELEALRLSDLEMLSQADAAEKMRIHQSTFQRALARARQKTADALVNGKAIKICGGDYAMPGGDAKGPIGIPRRKMGGLSGPSGICVWPKCNHEQAHVKGRPCAQTKCGNCGTLMTRG